jgi:spore coat protein CotF
MYQQQSSSGQTGYSFQQHPQHCQVSDQDLANLVLNEFKRIAGEYATANLEASHPQVRQMFESLLQSTLQDHARLFQLMNQLNMYGQPSQAPSQELHKEQQKNGQTWQKLQSFVQQYLGGGNQMPSVSQHDMGMNQNQNQNQNQYQYHNQFWSQNQNQNQHPYQSEHQLYQPYQQPYHQKSPQTYLNQAITGYDTSSESSSLTGNQASHSAGGVHNTGDKVGSGNMQNTGNTGYTGSTHNSGYQLGGSSKVPVNKFS